MQSITLNNANQCNSAQSVTYGTVRDWLEKYYEQGPSQNLNPHILSLEILEKTIGYTFQDKALFLQALTHTSFAHESSLSETGSSNERLEFLGDSIVNLIITAELYKTYPDFSEGELSKLRGALVNEKMFSELAAILSLSENVFIGRGEWKQKGHLRVSLLADAFEALLGAIYFEGGFTITEEVFKRIITLYNTQTEKDFFEASALQGFDPKTQLQEICMSLYQEHPRYISKEEGKNFVVSIWLKEKCLIESVGISKKKLEKELAKIVLDEKRYQI